MGGSFCVVLFKSTLKCYILSSLPIILEETESGIEEAAPPQSVRRPFCSGTG